MAQIIIAEDDASMRQFLTLALERAGHKVVACEDGIAALRAVEAHTETNLLLADIVMPGMDGIELAKKAHEIIPALKIMFITGFAAVAMNQLKNGSEGSAPATPEIMAKPFHLRDLVNRVEELLAA
jgi:two-component system cell cycle response regulator CpdR